MSPSPAEVRALVDDIPIEVPAWFSAYMDELWQFMKEHPGAISFTDFATRAFILGRQAEVRDWER